jgi:hypothetical protein
MSKTSKLEDFVPFEIAQKLKEKGYPLLRVIKQRGEPIIYDLPKNHPNWQNCNAYYIPTISQVLKWLREEKKIYIGISYMPKIINETGILNDFYYPTFQKIGLFEPMFFIGENNTYDSYEKAAIAGIKYVLDKNLI